MRKHPSHVWLKQLAACTLCWGTLQAGHAASPSPEEKLGLQQIAQFWKEGNGEEAKKAILTFLSQFEDSSVNDNVNAMLGDLYFAEGAFDSAITAYRSIRSDSFRCKVLVGELQALFATQRYDEASDLAGRYLRGEMGSDLSWVDEVRFVRAESLCRMAASASQPSLVKKFANGAKEEYKKLIFSRYKEASLPGFATALTLLEEDTHAAAIYTSLAGTDPTHAEEHIWHAAGLLLKGNRKDAIALYEQVMGLQGPHAPLATHNLMVLLYETKQYQQLLKMEETLRRELPAHDLPLCDYFMGMSHYHMEHHEQALTLLSRFLDKAPQESSLHYIAALALVSSGCSAERSELLEKGITIFRSHYGEDERTEKILLFAAAHYMEKGDSEAAVRTLSEILNSFPATPQREAILFNRATLRAQLKQWRESAEEYLAFLEEFPSSSRSADALRGTLTSLEQDCEVHPANTEMETLLIKMLEQASLSPQLATSEQRCCHYRLITFATDRKRWSMVQRQGKRFLEQYPGDSWQSEVLYALTIAHEKQGSVAPLFAKGGGEQMKLSPEQLIALEEYLSYSQALVALESDPTPWLLRLYNGNLLLKQQLESDPALAAEARAAEALYTLIVEKRTEVLPKNRTWLMSYLATGAADATKRQQALTLFEVSLPVEREEGSLKLKQLSQQQQPWLTKYALLLEMEGESTLAHSLLSQIAAAQELELETYQSSIAPVLWEKARLEKQQIAYSQAIDTYQKILELVPSDLDRFHVQALLEKARLQYQLLTQAEIMDETQLMQVLEILKGLQMRKHLAHEPTHIEAALDYVEIRSSMMDPSSRSYRTLRLLQNLKEDFTTPRDIISKEYKQAATLYPEEAELVNLYLRYVDAEVSRLQLAMAQETGLAEEVETIRVQTLCELEGLLAAHDRLTPYLQQRVKASLEALR